jgi:hypothetical protein
MQKVSTVAMVLGLVGVVGVLGCVEEGDDRISGGRT